MEGIVILVCLVLLAGLFVLLRYEAWSERGKEHGELLEPLHASIIRGAQDDAQRVLKYLRRRGD